MVPSCLLCQLFRLLILLSLHFALANWSMPIHIELPGGGIIAVWALEDPLVLLRGNYTVGMPLGTVPEVVVVPKLSLARLTVGISTDLATLH